MFFLVFSCFSVGLFDISKLSLVRTISLILCNRDFGYSSENDGVTMLLWERDGCEAISHTCFFNHDVIVMTVTYANDIRSNTVSRAR